MAGKRNWFIPNYVLTNLFKALEGKMPLDSPRILSQKTRKELELFKSRQKEAFVYHADISLPWYLLIFLTKLSTIGNTAQKDKPLEWIYLHDKCSKIWTAYLTLLAHPVNQRRTWCQLLCGFDPWCIIVPLTNNWF